MRHFDQLAAESANEGDKIGWVGGVVGDITRSSLLRRFGH